MPIYMTPVGTVHSAITELVDDIWGNVRARVELDPERFGPEALAGLEEFSHVEVVFYLDRIADPAIEFGARRPRGRADWPLTGIFAQRSKNRPNRIGVTVCRLLTVNRLTIEVEGLDAVDGTAVLDIKPYLREFGPRGEVRQPGWASELMMRYWENA